MKFQRMFGAASAFILVAVLALSSMPVSVQGQQQYMNMQEGGSLPLPSGVTPDYSVETSARLSFRPNPVGVGQQVLINALIVPPVHVSRYLKDLTIIITKPDGAQQVFKKRFLSCRYNNMDGVYTRYTGRMENQI